jgi:hypothetical protein
MISCCHGRKQEQRQFESTCRHVSYYRLENTIETLDKRNDCLYKNKFPASAMMLHDSDATMSKHAALLWKPKIRCFKKMSGVGLLLHLAKHLFYVSA